MFWFRELRYLLAKTRTARTIPTGERVIAYASRKFTPAELRWHVREQEAWAIVWGTEHFHEYLSNGHFFVETDHQSLQWLFACENGFAL